MHLVSRRRRQRQISPPRHFQLKLHHLPTLPQSNQAPLCDQFPLSRFATTATLVHTPQITKTTRSFWGINCWVASRYHYSQILSRIDERLYLQKDPYPATCLTLSITNDLSIDTVSKTSSQSNVVHTVLWSTGSPGGNHIGCSELQRVRTPWTSATDLHFALTDGDLTKLYTSSSELLSIYGSGIW